MALRTHDASFGWGCLCRCFFRRTRPREARPPPWPRPLASAPPRHGLCARVTGLRAPKPRRLEKKACCTKESPHSCGFGHPLVLSHSPCRPGYPGKYLPGQAPGTRTVLTRRVHSIASLVRAECVSASACAACAQVLPDGALRLEVRHAVSRFECSGAVQTVRLPAPARYRITVAGWGRALPR